MRKRILILFLFLCSFLFSNAQIFKLYNDPETNRFIYLSHNDAVSLTIYESQLYETEFTRRMYNDWGYSIYTYAPLNHSIQYPLNYINDSVFIAQNHLNDLDTLRCNSSDSSTYELGDFPQFEYVDHAIDHASGKCYRLLIQSKYNRYAGLNSIYCNQNYFILKSKAYPQSGNLNYHNTYDSIERYYKFSYTYYQNTRYNLLQRYNNSFYLTGNGYDENTNTGFLDITELDSNLQVIQTKHTIHSIDKDYPFIDYKFLNNKNYFITYTYTPGYFYGVNPSNKYDSGYIWIYDTNLNLLDSVKFSNNSQYKNYFNQLKGGKYFFFETDTSTIINVTNDSNDTIRRIELPTRNKILIAKDSSFCMLQMESSLYYNNGTYTDIFAYHWSKTGHFINKTSLFELGLISLSDQNTTEVYYDIDSFNNVIFGFTYDGGISSHYYYNTSNYFNLDATRFISGNITNDINRNCNNDSAEIPAKNILVELQLNGHSFFTISDDKGKFRFTPYDTGHARVILHLENQTTYSSVCRDTVNVVLSDTLANPESNFLVQTLFCDRPVPKLSVDISTSFLRRCFDNLYILTVVNESTDTAHNAYIDLELDAHLMPVDTAFQSAQNLGNNTYRFLLNDVWPLQTIRKQLKIKVDCDSTIIGQTHCVKATSYPYTSCIIADAPYMQATASCRNDSVIFTIKNIGYPEISDNFYRVIVNDTVNYQGYLHFTMSNSTQTLSYYNPEGKTFRLETKQLPAFINEDTILSVAIEGCGNPNFSIGYITMYPQDDDRPDVSIDCHHNWGSYDPNDKSANPVGYDDTHLIENTQAIEYTIHFQNLGNYAASFVTVTDTLYPAFDITTLHVLGSSSDYTLSIIDSNILQFRFLDINLPAAINDSLLSNGYIKFSVKPKKNTAIGTSIHNNAFITFDFNDAVKTNTVQHEIGKDFLGMNLISLVKNNLYNNLNTKVYPNPFNQTATLTFDYHQPTQLTVFSLDGKIVHQSNTTTNFYLINRNTLADGVYIYELRNGKTKELLDTGKLIIQ